MKLLLFKYEEENHFNDFRTVDIDGKLWFVASDVCSLLGYKRTSETIKSHCKEQGTVKRRIPTNSGEQEMLLINEANLYRLIVKSQLPTAERFESWIFEEVLPSIRKTGAYSVGINRQEPKDFIIRYMENFDKVEKGHFSVINQLFINLYGRLEHSGYQIPNKAIDGKRFRPDVSVGLGFSKFLKEKYPEHAENYKYYSHRFADINQSFDARQYPNEILHIFIKYVEDFWIPKNAFEYFRTRDIKALDYLPKLIA